MILRLLRPLLRTIVRSQRLIASFTAQRDSVSRAVPRAVPSAPTSMSSLSTMKWKSTVAIVDPDSRVTTGRERRRAGRSSRAQLRADYCTVDYYTFGASRRVNYMSIAACPLSPWRGTAEITRRETRRRGASP